MILFYDIEWFWPKPGPCRLGVAEYAWANGIVI